MTGVTGLILAAGAGSRFGGGKLLATIGGRPVLGHVLDTIAAAGLTDVVVVLGRRRGRRSRRPSTGTASGGWSTRRRSAACRARSRSGSRRSDPTSSAILVALGDQPLVSIDAIRALLDAPVRKGRPIVVPAYDDEHGRNPVLIRRAGFGLVGEVSGDRGLGPVIAAHPELVDAVPVAGSNPDVDTQADLARAIEASWAARVRANREQVERIREVPDGADFYAPVNSLFRADPTRTDDPLLDELLRLVAVGRDLARRRGGRRPVRAADRARARPVGRVGRRPRRVAVDARGAARDRRGLRDRERPDRPCPLATRRSAREPGRSRRTSP